MVYLNSFTFPDENKEIDFIWGIQRTCYNSIYPFKTLTSRCLGKIDFKPITILYGGNGSGKTTALNIIAEKTKVNRDSIYNKSSFFHDYVDLCKASVNEIPSNRRIITSDDVFDYMLNIRSMNDGVDLKREELFKDYLDTKKSEFRFRTLDDYEQLKKVNFTRRTTQSKYVKEQLTDNIRTFSNGENAFNYFTQKIEENGLYILDEPENSLSPKRQMELVGFIVDSARFFKCQFIISTHSPFLLAMQGAKIYDLDEAPCIEKKWTELENVRTYYEFFKEHSSEFV